MVVRKKLIEQITIPVRVIQRDIKDGQCGLPGRCMEKVAIERALRDKDPKGGDHKVRIDAGICKFTLWGGRWRAITPKIAKNSLIQFDSEEKARRKARKTGEEFTSKVQPHAYRLTATKVGKTVPMTKERMEQIYAARRKRKYEGKPDKIYSLHKRVKGLGNVHA